MAKPTDKFWELKLDLIKAKLEDNNFEVHVVETGEEAKELTLNRIIPDLSVETVSWGGSMSFISTGLFHALMEDERLTVFNTFDRKLSIEEQMDVRRKSLQADLFIASSNAVTEEGHLVNLDMIGNRIGAIGFGPKNVILIVGRNKICADLEEAMNRIKSLAAPMNAMNLGKKTPCTKTGFCQDCKSPDRICNTWAITEKCFPPKRVKVILVNQELGF